MASKEALAHARTLLNFVNTAEDDPRRTRIDLLQVGNHMAANSARTPELFDLLRSVRSFVRGQVILKKDLRTAAGKGWPVLPAFPGPISYFYAGVRLAAHAALRNSQFIDTYESSISNVALLTSRVTKALKSSESDLFSAGVLVAAEEATKSAQFRSRLIAASKDIQQIVTSDEFPRPGDFQQPMSTRSEWPPLRFGTLPVSGGVYNERPTDWETPGFGGDDNGTGSEGGDHYGDGGKLLCDIGSTEADIICAVGVVAVVIVVIACKP